MTINISPEAVERLAIWHDAVENPTTAATLRALSASQAETAAAYEAGRADGMREAAKIATECSEIAVQKKAESEATGERLIWWIAKSRSNMVRDLIIAAIPKGKDHE